MKNISKILLFLAIAVFLVSGTSMATPVTITDTYWGGNDHGYGDVIGDTGSFQIIDANLDRSGSMLSIIINTNFAGKGDDKLFSSYTMSPSNHAKDRNGIGYGDLFLSSSWDPYGSNPYKYDTNANGTLWTYGLALDNRWSSSGGTITLYSLNGSTNDSNAYLSQDFITGATFRNGQEVAVDKNSATVTNTGTTGTWSISGNTISFLIDIKGTSLISGDEIAIHWGETCGNDVIEGSASIPEPTQMLLFGTALIGLAGIGRKKFFK
jgi:hypothetical protein